LQTRSLLPQRLAAAMAVPGRGRAGVHSGAVENGLS